MFVTMHLTSQWKVTSDDLILKCEFKKCEYLQLDIISAFDPALLKAVSSGLVVIGFSWVICEIKSWAYSNN